MLQNYSQLVERISRSSGLAVEDIERRIEAKRAKLSGLISKEGAAQVVASELGISFEKEKMKVSELLGGMKRVNVIGKIIELSPVREYNKNNRQGKVCGFVLADETGNIRSVLWDTNHIALIEKGQIKQGDIVEITNASIRNNELHLTGFSDIKLSNEIMEKIKTEKILNENNISELKQGENVGVRAFIVQMFEPRFFNVCPACNKKLNELGGCEEHGKVAGERRALLSLVLDDGTETIRAVFFSEQIGKVMDREELEGEVFIKKRIEMLGKEMFFSGQARKSQIYDNLEFFVSDSQEIDIDKLIEKLEKR
ncbi:MAG: OB-fold nucleic acid binding domain-containing protein [Nanoarchaeota archaeon]|nr:OB-fold nucleic acid binding domain-containing protein [Nanoarchaeota archaeon]